MTVASYIATYFATHLDKAFWTGLSAETKAAATAMATNDVLALLDPGVDPECDAALKAVAEQAVYLARNYENQNEGKIVTGEGVEGISQNFAIIGTPGIAPRAEFYIKLAKKTTSRVVSITRG